METTFITYINLLLIIAFLVMIAQRIKLAYPIVLVLGGLLLSLLNIFPAVIIEPEIIFVIFLPPILYDAAWQTSWKDFWRWRRIIFSYAFIIVIVTAFLIAYTSSSIIPGFSLALGFLLGGIVSPPDAVSATSIMKEVNVPKRISAIIEGESLLNDASSIIVFRYALAAVATGSFVLQTAALDFSVVIIMGALTGVAIALVFYAIHRWMPTTPSIDLVLTFVAPYMMYIVAERFHFSGVLAVVSGGLLLSNKRQTILSPLSRIQGVNVWSIIAFVLNCLIFMLIGLQLPMIVQQLGTASIWQAIKYSLIIAFVLIASRLLIALGTTIFTMFVSNYIKTADRRPGFRAPIILGWAGMRGVVSLAAALSIPHFITGNVPFPQRNLILFITFVVILVTLVLQGLTLPLVIRLANLKDPDYKISDTDQELMLQKKLSRFALNRMQESYKDKIDSNDLLRGFYQRLQNKLLLLENINNAENLIEGDNTQVKEYETIRNEILEGQRKLLENLNKKDGISEEIVKKYLLILDQQDEQLKQQVKLF
jgi:monovalent cation/hydrogen antiporter